LRSAVDDVTIIDHFVSDRGKPQQITTPAPQARHQSIFYRPDALADTQPTVSMHWSLQRFSGIIMKEFFKIGRHWANLWARL